MLEAGRAPEEAHRAGDQLKLPEARHSECCVWVCPKVQDHLPEASCDIYGWEQGAAWSANFSDTLTYIFHRVFVCVTLIIESYKVLH